MIQVEISYWGGEQERDLRIYLARQPIKVLTLSKFQNCVMSVPQIHDTHIDKNFLKKQNSSQLSTMRNPIPITNFQLMKRA